MSIENNYKLTAFNTIKTFVNELYENFGETNHELCLYHRLLEKTTETHDKAISKHLEAFRSFCIDNRDALINKDVTKIHNKVEYSSKVFIDFNEIFKTTDKETNEVIFKHLLTISAFVDPTAKAKEILKKAAVTGSKEGDFIQNILSKVEDNINLTNADTSNPMGIVSSLLTSGVFDDIIQTMGNGFKDGSFNLGSMVNSLQSIVKEIPKNEMSKMNGFDPNDMLNMISSLAPLATSSNGDNNGLNLEGFNNESLSNLLSGLNINLPTTSNETVVDSNDKAVVEEISNNEENL
jgi:hypothetical protein